MKATEKTEQTARKAFIFLIISEKELALVLAALNPFPVSKAFLSSLPEKENILAVDKNEEKASKTPRYFLFCSIYSSRLDFVFALVRKKTRRFAKTRAARGTKYHGPNVIKYMSENAKVTIMENRTIKM